MERVIPKTKIFKESSSYGLNPGHNGKGDSISQTGILK